MYLGIVLLIVGLGLLGITLAKVFSSDPQSRGRQWYGIALLGAFLSLAGLAVTLYAIKKPLEGEVDKVAVQEKPLLPEPATEIEPFEPPPASQPKKDEENPEINDKNRNLSPKVRKILERRKKQLEENPNGKPYSKEDYKYFHKQYNKILNGYDQVIHETITGSPPPDKAHISTNKLWKNFSYNHHIWISNLQMKALQKNGPGTAEIKKRILYMCKLFDQMQRHYHNSVMWDEEINDQMIAYKIGEIERVIAEIEEIKKERGITD